MKMYILGLSKTVWNWIAINHRCTKAFSSSTKKIIPHVLIWFLPVWRTCNIQNRRVGFFSNNVSVSSWYGEQVITDLSFRLVDLSSRIFFVFPSPHFIYLFIYAFLFLSDKIKLCFLLKVFSYVIIDNCILLFSKSDMSKIFYSVWNSEKYVSVLILSNFIYFQLLCFLVEIYKYYSYSEFLCSYFVDYYLEDGAAISSKFVLIRLRNGIIKLSSRRSKFYTSVVLCNPEVDFLGERKDATFYPFLY